MSGLKNTQATAITRQEMVSPTIKAKRKAAKETSPPNNQPTRGIHLRIAMIGEKRDQKPKMQATIPSGLKILPAVSTPFFCSSKKWPEVT